MQVSYGYTSQYYCEDRLGKTELAFCERWSKDILGEKKSFSNLSLGF